MAHPPEPAAPATGRLAPSPTGDLHVGHSRSFLVAWWHARSRGGRVVLRIEDLDEGRVRPGAAERCVRDLEWLGLDWDEGPHLQSEDTEEIRAAADELVARGLAYACVCTRREVREAASAPHGGETRYPGTCRGRFGSREEAERETGRAAALRFLVPGGNMVLADGLLGPVEADVAAEVGDFPIARRDGAFAYQLAVVVDDARQGIDEVVRGADLLPSTARQALLQDALGLPRPRWWHLPLVQDDAGERLAKRSGGLALARLREEGADPRALVAWAARSAGVDAGERAEAREVAGSFAIERVPREPVRFGERERAMLLGARA